MRDASLHIKKSDLVKILQEIEYGKRTPAHVIANEIFKGAKTVQITNRYLQILGTTKKTKKKIAKSMESDTDVPANLVETFNRILVDMRQKSNQYGKIRIIRKDSRDYILLKEIAKNAYNFAVHFDIVPKTDGYKEYIEIGMSMMRKYSLNRFKYYDDKIYQVFEDKLTVLLDEHKEETEEFYSIWQKVMLEYSDFEDMVNIKDDMRKYSYIVLGRQDADKVDADYTDWIMAQFEGLAFIGVIPELSQLSGDGALTRYERYLRSASNLDDNENKKITDIYE